MPLAAEEAQPYELDLDLGLDDPEIGSIADAGNLEERGLSRNGAIKRPPGSGPKKGTPTIVAKPTATRVARPTATVPR